MASASVYRALGSVANRALLRGSYAPVSPCPVGSLAKERAAGVGCLGERRRLGETAKSARLCVASFTVREGHSKEKPVGLGRWNRFLGPVQPGPNNGRSQPKHRQILMPFEARPDLSAPALSFGRYCGEAFIYTFELVVDRADRDQSEPLNKGRRLSPSPPSFAPD